MIESSELSNVLFSLGLDGARPPGLDVWPLFIEAVERRFSAARAAADAAARAKSDFMATMSHELRTPLNGVMGMSELMLGTELTVQQKEYQEIIRRSAESLLATINDILEYPLLQAGAIASEELDFDLPATVAGVAEIVSARAHDKGLQFVHMTYKDVPVRIRGDAKSFRRVLLHLLDNAVTFTETGEVILRIKLEGAAAVRIEVTDTGIGMTPEVSEKVFLPFTQGDSSTTRKYGGTGLGLAICKHLVEHLGGEIGFDTAEGRGTVFWATLPFKPVSDRPEPAHVRTDYSTTRALIVDDNPHNPSILHHQLAVWGMRTLGVQDGAQALEQLNLAVGRGEPFDLVFLDMRTPALDGVQVASMLKADPAFRHLPLIMLGSQGLLRQVEEAKKAGISACMTKPIQQSDLFDCIVDVLGATGDPSQAATSSTKEILSALEPGARLLVVEDNRMNQKVVLGILKKLGFAADVAYDGLEAVDAVDRTPYSAVLMDCQMPRMDGFEATNEIRRREKEGKHLPIIALTANVSPGDREKCLDAGMDDYLTKPLQMDLLESTLHRWLNPSGTPLAAPASQPRPAPAAPAAAAEHDEPPRGMETPTLDQDRLQSLRELQTEGQPDIVAELVAMYLHDASATLAKIARGCEGKNMWLVQRSAQELKGSSSNIGAARLAAMCESLQGLDVGDDTRATQLHAALAVEFAEVKRLLLEATGQLDATPEPEAPVVEERKHVLVVEDGALNRKLLAKILDGLGFKATLVEDGPQAVALAAQGGLAAVLMDCHLPTISGYEATAQIRAQTVGPRLPIIALTANDNAEERKKCRDAGMDDYLAKPVRPEDLRLVLERWTRTTAQAPRMATPPPEAPVDAPVPEEDDLESCIDRSVLDSLRELQMEGEPDVIVELVDLFLSEAPTNLGALKGTFSSGDAEAFAQAAHALKGSAGNIGACRLKDLCATLERLGNERALHGAAGTLAQLERVYARTEQELRGAARCTS